MKVDKLHFKRLTCLQIATLDWLFLGRPDVAPRSLRLGARLSAKQWSVVRMIEHLAVGRNFPIKVGAVDMGRSAMKIEDFQKCIDVLGRATADLHVFDGGYGHLKPSKDGNYEQSGLRCGRPAGRTDRETVPTAKPIIADRIPLPGPPRFDPQLFFDDSTLERYNEPLSKGLKPEEVDQQPPRVSVRASHYDKLELYKKLAQTGRLLPVADRDHRPGYTSGLFAVGQDQVKDRLILDGHPANLLDRGQRKWCLGMASGSSLRSSTSLQTATFLEAVKTCVTSFTNFE